MKIDNNMFASFIKSQELKGVVNTDRYDLDIQINAVSTQPQVLQQQMVTSKSLCTPGCGNTGTNNSFCC